MAAAQPHNTVDKHLHTTTQQWRQHNHTTQLTTTCTTQLMNICTMTWHNLCKPAHSWHSNTVNDWDWWHWHWANDELTQSDKNCVHRQVAQYVPHGPAACGRRRGTYCWQSGGRCGPSTAPGRSHWAPTFCCRRHTPWRTPSPPRSSAHCNTTNDSWVWLTLVCRLSYTVSYLHINCLSLAY